MEESPKKARGWAAMSPEQRAAAGAKGGRSTRDQGTGHKLTRMDAQKGGHITGAALAIDRQRMQERGRKGGAAVSADREHMAEIGRAGGVMVSEDRVHMAEIGKRGRAARKAAAPAISKDEAL